MIAFDQRGQTVGNQVNIGGHRVVSGPEEKGEINTEQRITGKTGLFSVQEYITLELETRMASSHYEADTKYYLFKRLGDMLGDTLADNRAYVIRLFDIEHCIPKLALGSQDYVYTLSFLCILADASQANVGEHAWSLPNQNPRTTYKPGDVVRCYDFPIEFRAEHYYIQGNDFLVWRRTA
jgi:hypothetical protein